jgi:hypothetical protein
LQEAVAFGRAAAHRTLALMAAPLAAALEALAEKSAESEETRTRARALSQVFSSGQLPDRFSHADVNLIERVVPNLASAAPVRVRPPVETFGLVTREDLRARLNQWLDELPDQPALVEAVSD